MCDGMNAKCRAVFEADSSSCSQSGVCKSGQCVNDLKTCQASVSTIVSNCQASCQMMSKSYGAVCLCDDNGMPSSDCWTKTRAYAFTADEGDDLQNYTDSCPSFCSCQCAEVVKGSSSASSSLLTANLFIFIIIIMIFNNSL